MTAKKRGGGRTTPKGTQPAGTGHTSKPGGRAAPARSFGPIVPAKGRAAQGPIGPTRSGHHRGNR
jgi:hypothetical protein